ncbi:MAG TPA: redoxin domain-containing protein [Terriglobales bacterium]|nr:redoxin domain-containing protein [Terriglobales bacterium]
MKQKVQAALAVLVCTFCIARPGASQETPVPPDVEQGAYVSVNWAELTHRNDGWQIASTHALGNWNSQLRPGDLILNIDGVDVSHVNPLSIASLLEDAYLRDVTVTVQRQRRTEELNVRLGQSQPDGYMTQFYKRFGIGASLMAQKQPAAVKIGDVIPGSPADSAGVKEGDELLAVDGHQVAGVNLRDIAEMVSSTRPVPVELRIRRGPETLIREVNRMPISQLYKQLQPAKVAFPMQMGLEAPTFKLQDMKSNWVSLEDFRGEWVLLTFWATWCIPCQKEVPVLNRLTHDYSARLAVLALDVDDKRENLERFIATNKVSYRVLIAGKSDDEVGKSYNVRGIPVNVIVSPDGKVRYVEKGFSSASPMEDYVHKLDSR